VYAADVNALGQKPSDSDGAQEWLDKRRTIKAKHSKPEIDRVLPILRGELERLDAAWKR
jgi:hypothetical protein